MYRKDACIGRGRVTDERFGGGSAWPPGSSHGRRGLFPVRHQGLGSYVTVLLLRDGSRQFSSEALPPYAALSPASLLARATYVMPTCVMAAPVQSGGPGADSLVVMVRHLRSVCRAGQFCRAEQVCDQPRASGERVYFHAALSSTLHHHETRQASKSGQAPKSGPASTRAHEGQPRLLYDYPGFFMTTKVYEWQQR